MCISWCISFSELKCTLKQLNLLVPKQDVIVNDHQLEEPSLQYCRALRPAALSLEVKMCFFPGKPVAALKSLGLKTGFLSASATKEL
jgi:hypothetical protein